MRSREGWRLQGLLRKRKAKLVSMATLAGWVGRVRRQEPDNPYWVDIESVIADLERESPGSALPAEMVIETLYEASMDSGPHGRPDAIKLLTAHGAKGLEFRHVIVMDGGDWRWSDEDRRLLYVAMTRAKETLTLFRVEDGRNPFLADLSSLEGVASLLPPKRPAFREDIERRYLTYGPAEMDIGYAGRCPAGHPIHAAIRATSVGTAVVFRQRNFETLDGRVIVGRLAKAVQREPREGALGIVYGVMVRTRQQTPAAYLPSIVVDQWEVPLVEVVEPCVQP